MNMSFIKIIDDLYSDGLSAGHRYTVLSYVQFSLSQVRNIKNKKKALVSYKEPAYLHRKSLKSLLHGKPIFLMQVFTPILSTIRAICDVRKARSKSEHIEHRLKHLCTNIVRRPIQLRSQHFTDPVYDNLYLSDMIGCETYVAANILGKD